MHKKIAFLIGMVSLSVCAEPSKSVAYLMNEPVTLFDRGLSELSKRVDESLLLEEFPELIKQLNAWAKYDWNANAIIINGTVYQKNATLESTTPSRLCERVIGRMKNNLGYGEQNFLKFGIGGLAPFFNHVGYTSKNEPVTLEKDIAGITSMKISVFSSENNEAPFAKRVTCVSNLTTSEIFYSDK